MDHRFEVWLLGTVSAVISLDYTPDTPDMAD